MSLTAVITLGVVALPFAFLAAFNDLKTMKIPNILNLSMLLSFVVVGIIVLPIGEYGLRLAVAAATLVLGFVLNALRLMGGGDAKYLTALAPFIDPRDIVEFLFLLSGIGLAALLAIFIMARLPVARRASPDWVSWKKGAKVPYGLALSGALFAYYLLKIYLLSQPDLGAQPAA